MMQASACTISRIVKCADQPTSVQQRQAEVSAQSWKLRSTQGSLCFLCWSSPERERVTRSSAGAPFSPAQAKEAVDHYTDLLWEGINERLEYTDMSEGPCAFSEAPAEGVFSSYSRLYLINT